MGNYFCIYSNNVMHTNEIRARTTSQSNAVNGHSQNYDGELSSEGTCAPISRSIWNQINQCIGPTGKSQRQQEEEKKFAESASAQNDGGVQKIKVP
jgi:hypothetical protein